MSLPPTRTRLAALTLATSAALVGLGTAPAAAQPRHPLSVAAASVRATPSTGTITITALANQPISTHALAGIDFSLTPVLDIDLFTDAGAARAQALIEGTATETPQLGTPIVLPTTDTDGQTVAHDLPLRLYLLHQLGERDDTGMVTGAPMTYGDLYIALPTQDPTDGHRVLDLDVFPKGAPVSPGGSTPTPVIPSPSPTTTDPAGSPVSPVGEPNSPSSPTAVPVTPAGTAAQVSPTDGSGMPVLPGSDQPGPGGNAGVVPQGNQPAVASNPVAEAIQRIIPAGEGAEFSVQDALVSIGAGLVLLSLLVAATRRRRDDHS